MVVTFNLEAFLQIFPEFTRVQANLPGCFTMAEIYCDNTNRSPVNSLQVRTTLLNLVTAHLAYLMYGAEEEASQLVGPVTQAKEGSVQVQVTLPKDITDYQAFWFQTKYGTAFWTASAAFRTFRYIPPSRPIATYVPRG